MEHARQTLIPWWDQTRIEAREPMVVGAGALGSAVGVALARTGVPQLTLLDPDVLEDHNLENQEYDSRDLGDPKVCALADRIKAIDPDVETETFVGTLQDYRGEGLPDVVFGCVDNVGARYFMSQAAVDTGVPLIDGGLHGLQGNVRTVLPGKTPCYHCYPVLPEPDDLGDSCSRDPIPTTFIAARVVASYQVLQFVRLAHGRHVPGHIQIDLVHGELHENDPTPNPECDACGGGAP